MPLRVDPRLVQKARRVLGGRTDLYWVVGGACSGKSTVSRDLADELDLATIDMDARIYGGFPTDPTRHPAVTRWFSADHPLGWVLSLRWDDFDALNRATNAEFLDLLADELGATPAPQASIVDGGFTHPSVLAQVVSPTRLVCLAVSPEQSARCWETSPERAEMRGWVRALPDPDAHWARFLEFDRRMSETMVSESHASGVPVVRRTPTTTRAALRERVRAVLGLGHRHTS